MPCYSPLKAYRLLNRKTENGKSVIVFSVPESSSGYELLDLPCSQCIGCRIDRSRQWALRCVHEASLYTHNCFITLTFNDENLDSKGSLVKSDFQKFMKRLRKKFKGLDCVKDSHSKNTYPIRYYHCGEYGAELQRPHHHACLFNFDFNDKELLTVRDGIRLFRSDSLEALWPFGYSTIGDVTWESAAYVARYIMKKQNGKEGALHYLRYDEDTGECWHLEPEYTTMSRRPGIGKNWFNAFKDDLYPKDFVTHNGKKFAIPKYYDKIYDQTNPETLQSIKNKRKERAKCLKHDNTPSRLNTKKICKEHKLKQLQRNLEL